MPTLSPRPTCAKPGCTSTALVGERLCLNHLTEPGPHSWRPEPGTWFKLWFAFCAVLAVALIGVGVWAVIALVTWVTSQ